MDNERTGTSSKSGTRSRKRLSRRERRRRIIIAKFITVIVIFVLLAVGISAIFRSCTVSQKTPEAVCRTLVEAYKSGSQRKIRKCYGVKKAGEDLQKEIDARIKYIEAHEATGLVIDDCGTIYEDSDYTYVYVTYELTLEGDKSYPCISTYMTQKKDEKYYVLAADDITDEMSSQAAEQYAVFMNTDAYKTYLHEYNAFLEANPGYEEQIAAKLA